VAKSVSPSNQIRQRAILWHALSGADAAARGSEKITGIVKAVAAAGIPVSRVEIHQNGTIAVVSAERVGCNP
jgi:hypothetical protein